MKDCSLPTRQECLAILAEYHVPPHMVNHSLAVAKLGAILRVADALDRSYSQRIREVHCSRKGDRFVISVQSVDDLFVEQLALRQKGPMFEDVYGLQVQLRRS